MLLAIVKIATNLFVKNALNMHKKWSRFAKPMSILDLEEALKAPTNEAPIKEEVAPRVKTQCICHQCKGKLR